MGARDETCGRRGPASRRAAIGLALVAAMVLLQVVIAGVVTAGAQDAGQTPMRLEGMRAMYAAEAGMNMALRELMENLDIDSDGGIGSISADGQAGNDPSLGAARLVVTRSAGMGGVIVITADGRCGSAVRRVSAQLSPN